MSRGTRGAYRKEDRVALPPDLQKELVEKAAAKYGNCQELAKALNIPKSSVHYYRTGRLTLPQSVLDDMLDIVGESDLGHRIAERSVTRDRSWATEYAQSIYREICREKLRLPTCKDLENDAELRRKAASIVSYILAEGSVWMQKKDLGEHAANITFATHERDLYDHFRSLCRDVFYHDIGPPQLPGNGAEARRGFLYSRFLAEWLIENGVPPGDKAASSTNLPKWVMSSQDPLTWIAALQPWCDGEGSADKRRSSNGTWFSLSQSRHTDLDLHTLPRELAWREDKRVIGLTSLRDVSLFDIPALQFCAALYRSEVFSDVFQLFRRLGLHPRLSISSLYLKNDGFWSCNWIIHIPPNETSKLVPMGLVLQERKRRVLENQGRIIA